ncbi:uncharacterized protein LOC135471907 isoform X3 [Liolophura sinensis]|uniref:uncharacterized protein LOC135471907 isoform X3 n=1 Tax=Liolophura sinensis TaxID=3198878 RepID=UPI0031592E39
MRSSLEDVVRFLHMLCKEKPGCPVEELKKLAVLKQLSRPLDCTLALLESFSSSLKKLSEWDNENKTHFIAVLLEHGLLDVLSAVFEEATENQNQGADPAKSLCIMDAICAISATTANAKTTLVKKYGLKFLHEILRSKSELYTLEAMKRVNLLMERCSLSVQDTLLQDAEIVNALQAVSGLVFIAGDYEIQVGVLECLFRFIPSQQRKRFSSKFFSDTSTARHFLDIKVSDFETDCRQFLNQLNSQLGSSYPRVISLSCLTACLGLQELKKPEDPNNAEFWVDFNTGSSRITLFCEQELCDSQGEETLWEIVSLCKSQVHSYILEVEKNLLVLTVSLKTSLEKCVPFVCAGQTEKYATLSFDLKFATAVTEALVGCFGEELNWTKFKRNPDKVSTAVTPFALNIRSQTHELQIREDVIMSSLQSDYQKPETDHVASTNNASSTPKVSEDSSEKHKAPKQKQKISVPVLAMTTPARLTYSEIQNKSVYQETSALEIAYDCENNTCQRDGTSSKHGPKSAESHRSAHLASEGKIYKSTGSGKSKDSATCPSNESPSESVPKPQGSPRLSFPNGDGKDDAKTTIKETGKSSGWRSKNLLKCEPKSAVHKDQRSLKPDEDTCTGSKTDACSGKTKDSASCPAKCGAKAKSPNLSCTGGDRRGDSKSTKANGASTPRTPIEKRTRSSRGKVKTPLLFQVTPKRTVRSKSSELSAKSALELGVSAVSGHKKNTGDTVFNRDVKVITNKNNKSAESSLVKEVEGKLDDKARHKKNSSEMSKPSAVADETTLMVNVESTSKVDPSLAKVKRKKEKVDHAKRTNKVTVTTDTEVKVGLKTRLGNTSAKTSCPTENNVKTNKKTNCKRFSEANMSSDKKSENNQDEERYPDMPDVIPDSLPDNPECFKTSMHDFGESLNDLATCEKKSLAVSVCAEKVATKFGTGFSRQGCKVGYDSTINGPSIGSGRQSIEKNVGETSVESSIECSVTVPNRRTSCLTKSRNEKGGKPSKENMTVDPYDFNCETQSSASSKYKSEASYKPNRIFKYRNKRAVVETKPEITSRSKKTKSTAKGIFKNVPKAKKSQKSLPHLLQKMEERVDQATVDQIETSPVLDNDLEPLTSKADDTDYNEVPDGTKELFQTIQDRLHKDLDLDLDLALSSTRTEEVNKTKEVRVSRRRKCKAYVTNYKETSESEDENPQKDENPDVSPTTLCSFQSDGDARTDISWLQSQSMKPPSKTYLKKPGFDFTSLSKCSYQTIDIYTDDFRYDYDEVLSHCISPVKLPIICQKESVTAENSDEKAPSQSPNEKTIGDGGNEVKNRGLETLCVCDLWKAYGDNPSLSLNVQNEDTDTDQRDLDAVTPAMSDLWNEYEVNPAFSQDVQALTAITSPLTVLSDSGEQQFPNCFSAYSSATRLPKSELKRKYGETCEEDNEDNFEAAECVEEELRILNPPLIPRRKLFKYENTEDHNTKRMDNSEVSVSAGYCSSEECINQFNITDQPLQIRAFMQAFGIDLEKQMKEKCRGHDSLVKDATKSAQNALDSVWEELFENRSQLRNNLQQNLLNELNELQKDIDHLKEEEDMTANFYKRQVDELQRFRESQELRLRNLKCLHLLYEQGIGKNVSKEKRCQISARKSLEKELVTLHKKIWQDFQHQEIGKLRHTLKNIL